MSKGRTAPYIPGANTTPVIQLPTDNIILPDGRVLRYLGWSAPTNAGGGALISLAQWMTADRLAVMASLDPLPHSSIKSKKRFLHVSISRHDRYPGWDEMSAICEQFFGNEVDAAMIRPRASDYVNVHQFCFHWWEMPVEWGLW